MVPRGRWGEVADARPPARPVDWDNTARVNLQALVAFMADRVHQSLQEMALVFQGLPSPERQRKLVVFVAQQRQRLLRLLALVRWLRTNKLRAAGECMKILDTVREHEIQCGGAADGLATAHDEIQEIKQPLYDLLTAAEVLGGKGELSMPGALRENYGPPWVDEAGRAAALQRLGTAIRARLLQTAVPADCALVSVAEGVAKFSVLGGCDVELTYLPGAPVEWRLLSLAFTLTDSLGHPFVVPAQIGILKGELQARIQTADAPVTYLLSVLKSTVARILVSKAVQEARGMCGPGGEMDGIMQVAALSVSSAQAEEKETGFKLHFWQQEPEGAPTIEVRIDEAEQLRCSYLPASRRELPPTRDWLDAAAGSISIEKLFQGGVWRTAFGVLHQLGTAFEAYDWFRRAGAAVALRTETSDPAAGPYTADLAAFAARCGEGLAWVDCTSGGPQLRVTIGKQVLVMGLHQLSGKLTLAMEGGIPEQEQAVGRTADFINQTIETHGFREIRKMAGGDDLPENLARLILRVKKVHESMQLTALGRAAGLSDKEINSLGAGTTENLPPTFLICKLSEVEHLYLSVPLGAEGRLGPPVGLNFVRTKGAAGDAGRPWRTTFREALDPAALRRRARGGALGKRRRDGGGAGGAASPREPPAPCVHDFKACLDLLLAAAADCKEKYMLFKLRNELAAAAVPFRHALPPGGGPKLVLSLRAFLAAESGGAPAVPIAGNVPDRLEVGTRDGGCVAEFSSDGAADLGGSPWPAAEGGMAVEGRTVRCPFSLRRGFSLATVVARIQRVHRFLEFAGQLRAAAAGAPAALPADSASPFSLGLDVRCAGPFRLRLQWPSGRGAFAGCEAALDVQLDERPDEGRRASLAYAVRATAAAAGRATRVLEETEFVRGLEDLANEGQHALFVEALHVALPPLLLLETGLRAHAAAAPASAPAVLLVPDLQRALLFVDALGVEAHFHGAGQVVLRAFPGLPPRALAAAAAALRRPSCSRRRRAWRPSSA